MATDSQTLSWQAIAVDVAFIGLLNGAQWAVSQVEFANVKETATEDRKQAATYYATGRDDLIRLSARLATLEAAMATISSKLAHDPVEDRTFQAVIAALGKQIDQIQAQITDINRQIAAALIIIDNNSSGPKHNALPQ